MKRRCCATRVPARAVHNQRKWLLNVLLEARPNPETELGGACCVSPETKFCATHLRLSRGWLYPLGCQCNLAEVS